MQQSLPSRGGDPGFQDVGVVENERVQELLLLFTHQSLIKYAEFAVLTAVVMKSSLFWDITPYSPLNVNTVHGVMSQKTELFLNKYPLPSLSTKKCRPNNLYKNKFDEKYKILSPYLQS
jgi:hypothetical protein